MATLLSEFEAMIFRKRFDPFNGRVQLRLDSIGFIQVAQPRPRGARCGSDVPEVLALLLQAWHCGRSSGAGTHLR